MLPTTREWVNKAESDYDVVLLLLRSRKRARLDPLAFHYQQCIEKYLKAKLTESAIPFPKTHDLFALLALALPVEPTWLTLGTAMSTVAEHAILPRYPGVHATPDEARFAVSTCRRVRKLVRKSLGVA
jgi:HEPN domain-containing protein